MLGTSSFFFLIYFHLFCVHAWKIYAFLWLTILLMVITEHYSFFHHQNIILCDQCSCRYSQKFFLYFSPIYYTFLSEFLQRDNVNVVHLSVQFYRLQSSSKQNSFSFFSFHLLSFFFNSFLVFHYYPLFLHWPAAKCSVVTSNI